MNTFRRLFPLSTALARIQITDSRLNTPKNITIDNCWFEDLGVAIIVKSNLKYNEDMPSRVSILNSRFVNAAGFGSINAPNNRKQGVCVEISNSYATVANNFTGVSFPDGQYLDPNNHFILAYNNEKRGVTVHGNTFQVDKLARTQGIMQYAEPVSGVLDCAGHKLVFAKGSSPAAVVSTLKSSLIASEYITIRADFGDIEFNNTNNINLLGSTLKLNIGETATFVKIDTLIEVYQLVSVIN